MTWKNTSKGVTKRRLLEVEKFSGFLHKALTHSSIPMEYRRYLLL